MHAARAIKANREKKEPPAEKKLKVESRRQSLASQLGHVFPRSPAVSIDTANKRAHPPPEDSDNLNFSYMGFVIAVFGAVPLIVGTFVEVPALWEIGICVTLVGLFIGIVFWCTELCSEAKKFSLKKNQLSTRGKIEDSNFLQVPDKKFHQPNGLESRRNSFQNDSVSVITPRAQSFGSPKHSQANPNIPDLHVTSISQYSSSEQSKSDPESSGTLGSNLRANGHLSGGPHLPAPPPPKLLLRGTRKDDGRVVSLVQPDPGLGDDSDSDAETVVEVPTSKPTIIQVQTLQEHRHLQSSSRDPEIVLGVGGGGISSLESSSSSFYFENETLPPIAQQHKVIRMPVMPQEVDKLQKCECGRYLLTERDKLIGVRISGGMAGVGGSSMPTTTYNSPSLGGTSSSSAGTEPPMRKMYPKAPPPPTGSGRMEPTPDSSVCSYNGSEADESNSYSYSAQYASPPPQPTNSDRTSYKGGKSHEKQIPNTSTGNKNEQDFQGENLVENEPSMNPSEFSCRKKTECCGANVEKHECKDGSEEAEAATEAASRSAKAHRLLKPTGSITSVDDEDKDRLLEELLELTDVRGIDEEEEGDRGGTLKSEGYKGKIFEANRYIDDDDEEDDDDEDEEDDDDEFSIPSKSTNEQKARSGSAIRPTSLMLPATTTAVHNVTTTDSSLSSSLSTTTTVPASKSKQTRGSLPTEGEFGPGTIKSSASSASSASTVVFIGEQNQGQQSATISSSVSYKSKKLPQDTEGTDSTKLEKQSNKDEQQKSSVTLTKRSSLDELLHCLEENQDREVLAVVSQ